MQNKLDNIRNAIVGNKPRTGIPKTPKTQPYGVSIGLDKNGYYAYTHRARSKSYPTQDQIPIKDLKFIDSTG